MSAATAQGGFFSISGRQWLIVLMVQLSNMLFGMTITLANLVLPQIRGTFSADRSCRWARPSCSRPFRRICSPSP